MATTSLSLSDLQNAINYQLNTVDFHQFQQYVYNSLGIPGEKKKLKPLDQAIENAVNELRGL